jgi:hypothetical protein
MLPPMPIPLEDNFSDIIGKAQREDNRGQAAYYDRVSMF